MIQPLFLAAATAEIPLVLLVPFGLLLLLIAVMPLTPARAHHWWEHNYPHVSLGLAVLVGGYYLLQVPAGGLTLTHTLHEYVSFIALIRSLFIRIHGRIRTTEAPVVPMKFASTAPAARNSTRAADDSMRIGIPLQSQVLSLAWALVAGGFDGCQMSA